MNHFLHGVAHATLETFTLPEPIVEIGSYQVPGQEDIANLRAFFPKQTYLGIDIRQGPGVDRVASVEQLPFADHSIGAILALNTFEHVARFWQGFAEIQRVLRPDGVLVVSCPFWFHIHHHPSDYWRFTPEALEMLLEDYPTKIIGRQGPAKKPLHVWAIAFGPDHTITHEQVTQYRHRLQQYAHEPQPRFQKLRYLLGRLIAGRRPFIPYLEQNQWEIQCHPPFLQTQPTPRTPAHALNS